MNNPIFLILYLSIIGLIIKYIVELKSDKTLVIVLALFGITCFGNILNKLLHTEIFVIVGFITGLTLAPIIFSIYILRQNRNQKDRLTRILMLIPTLTLFTVYQFKGLHIPAYGILVFMLITSILIGGWVIIKKPNIKEIMPFQVIMIFLIIDLLIYLMN